jgi:hypothetical protein
MNECRKMIYRKHSQILFLDYDRHDLPPLAQKASPEN